jgi:phosphoribosylformylglycinamidine (FGAM) synthase-like enzyme
MSDTPRGLAADWNRYDAVAKQAIALGSEEAWAVIDEYESGELEIGDAEQRIAALAARQNAARKALRTRVQ